MNHLRLVRTAERHFLVSEGMQSKIAQASTIPQRGTPVSLELSGRVYAAEEMSVQEGKFFAVDHTVASRIIDDLGLNLHDSGIAEQAIEGA